MHNFSLKIIFIILFIAGFGLTVFGDVVPYDDTTGDIKPDKETRSGTNTLTDNYIGVCTGVNVRIRSMPSTKSAVISSNTMKGDKFEILGTQGDWHQIRLPEYVTLWIHSKYVSAEKGVKDGVLTGDDVNIRTSDSTKSTVVGKVSKGDSVEIIGKKGEWFMIIPPVQATGWISGNFINILGDSSKLGMTMLEERNKYLKRAASYYASRGDNVLAEAYRGMIRKIIETPPPPPENLEKAPYEAFLLRYNQADTEPATADVNVLKALAQEILIFANGCKSEVKDSALSLYNELNTKIQASIEHQKAIKDEEERKRLIEIANANRQKMLNEVNIRLMRKDADKYVAKGVVVDKQLSSGVTIYFLSIGGVEKYRLVTINQNINIRESWRREVGIVGKIIYDEDEQYPVILCEKIETLDKK